MASASNVTKCEIRYVPADQISVTFGKVLSRDPAGFLNPETMELIDMPGFDGTKRPVEHPKNLETIYRHYQTIDETDEERTHQLKTRSMTYGDCIVVNGNAYYVADEGFVTIENGEVVQVTEDSVPAVKV